MQTTPNLVFGVTLTTRSGSGILDTRSCQKDWHACVLYIYIYMHDCKFSMRELLCVKTLMHEHGCAHSSSLSWLGARAARVAMVWLMDGSCTRFLRNIPTCMYICSWQHLNSWSTALPAPNAELCTQRPGNTWQTDQGWQLRVSNK